jgi:hypothetical protein
MDDIAPLIAPPIPMPTQVAAPVNADLPPDAVVAEPAPRRAASKAPRSERPVSRAVPRPRPSKRTTNNELTDLRTWLEKLNLGINPAVHVNGPAFVSCVVTVDFGTPRKGIRLTSEESTELVTRLRAATKAVTARDVKIGVMTDHSAGIWWTTIS